MNNEDIRAKILQDIYSRVMNGEEPRTNAHDYASFLGIDEMLTNFNLQYLVESGLVDGKAFGSIGTTRKIVMVWGITPFGIQAVEGYSGRDLAINYSIINVNAPVTGSQIAVGKQISQAQSVTINSFSDLYNYIDNNLDQSQKATLDPLLKELEAGVKTDSVKVSILRKIGEAVKTWGPVAIPIIEAIAKLTGFKPA